jgi:SPP1 family predicted phage head-tail adaptor
MNVTKKLRHRITIQNRTNVRDDVTGEFVEDWADLYTNVPAAIEPLSVREFLQSQADQSAVAVRITIRYKAGLDATLRILHGDVIYNPAGFLPDPDSGREWITSPCSQGLNEG